MSAHVVWCCDPKRQDAHLKIHVAMQQTETEIRHAQSRFRRSGARASELSSCRAVELLSSNVISTHSYIPCHCDMSVTCPAIRIIQI